MFPKADDGKYWADRRRAALRRQPPQAVVGQFRPFGNVGFQVGSFGQKSRSALKRPECQWHDGVSFEQAPR